MTLSILPSFEIVCFCLCCLYRPSVFGVEPDLTREGGSIPVTLTLQETTGKNVMLLPIGACDDGAHSQNEKIDRVNYVQGVSAASIADVISTLLKTRSMVLVYVSDTDVSMIIDRFRVEIDVYKRVVRMMQRGSCNGHVHVH